MKKEQEKPNLQAAGSIATPNIKKRGWKGFYRDVIREMKYVNWPTRHETYRLTGVVLAVCILATSVLFVLSTTFNSLYNIIIKGS